MKSVNTFCDSLIELGSTDNQPNARGNTVHRYFAPSERYLIDFAENFADEHFQQFDTDQDAGHFGVWLNPHSLRILTYSEGDWTLVSCRDKERYNAEIRAMIEFFDEGVVAHVIEEGGRAITYRQDRQQFLV